MGQFFPHITREAWTGREDLRGWNEQRALVDRPHEKIVRYVPR
jgi:hypothetical protein